jgi:hypothetical protein
MGMAVAELVARGWREQQRLAEALAAARAVRAEHQRQVARADRLRRVTRGDHPHESGVIVASWDD